MDIDSQWYWVWPYSGCIGWRVGADSNPGWHLVDDQQHAIPCHLRPNFWRARFEDNWGPVVDSSGFNFCLPRNQKNIVSLNCHLFRIYDCRPGRWELAKPVIEDEFKTQVVSNFENFNLR